ncbi:glycosyltransferase [Actomonas aquatica]|uniref:Glycosyltransferase n=1 Tax=Actomonas aquatica TaxID=2866162 RepID=A0ABZ1CAH2_9BACT|nr:glycosyltransferase [Opitutus sp. WL0086]WRQ88471.1 glycosyltransferase [Opitutus sp. WL0086]
MIHTITSIEARFGGPARSVPSLAAAEQQLGLNLEVCSLGQPHTVTSSPWPSIAPIRVFPRQSPDLVGRSTALKNHLENATSDLIHHHGLWHRTLHYAHQKKRRDGVPLVISPRGMLMPWARRHHGWRKRVAARLLHPGALSGASGWHATSAEEARAIRDAGFRQPICISPNGVTLPTAAEQSAAASHWHRVEPATTTRRVALFYSRFHSKKRVRECIELWHELAPKGWLLLVVGIPEEFSVQQLRDRVQQLNSTDAVKVHDGTNAPPPYAAAELFLLPTQSENFGMVVAEALAHGVPALVTDDLPWAELGSRGAGWSEPWIDPYRAQLQSALALGTPELAEMGERGRLWMNEAFSWTAAAGKLVDFYHSLLP